MTTQKKQPFGGCFLLPIIWIVLDRLQGSAISKQREHLRINKSRVNEIAKFWELRMKINLFKTAEIYAVLLLTVGMLGCQPQSSSVANARANRSGCGKLKPKPFQLKGQPKWCVK